MEQIGNEAGLTFEELPLLVHFSIFQFLDDQSMARLKQTCFRMKWTIEQEYGIHVRLPARTFHNWTVNNWSLQRTGKQVTDKMITDALSSMEGKVVRSLQMHEMPPRMDPFPLHRFLNSPRRLVHVFMKYVDVNLLESLLGLCPNLRSFSYSTGIFRPLPRGILSVLLLQTSFEPVRIPSRNEKFLEKISKTPSTRFNLHQLTNFTLMMTRLSTFYQSDWANCLYLLLTMSQAPLSNMKKFVFYSQPGIFMDIKDSMQILACLGQFLSQCLNLIKFEYISFSRSYDRRYFLVNTSSNFPQIVLSGLINKFGIELVKEVKEERRLQNKALMMEPVKRIFEMAGRSLRALREVDLQITDMCDGEVFKEFLKTLPSLRCLNIIDAPYGWTEPANDIFHFLLFSQQESGANYPFYDTLETLSIKSLILQPRPFGFVNQRSWQTVSLDDFFLKMKALTSMEIHEREKNAPKVFNTVVERPDMLQFPPFPGLRQPNLPGVFAILQEERGENENRVPNVVQVIPDFAILQREENPMYFQNVRVLKLYEVKILPQHAKKLIFFTELRTLILKFSVSNGTGAVGMHSQHLIELMCTLRKLEKLIVSRVIFTPTNRSTTRRALKALGKVKKAEGIRHRLYCQFKLKAPRSS